MIVSTHSQAALKAINIIFVVARDLAYDESQFSSLASAMDIAEYLPRLIADPKDRTSDFRAYLEDLAKKNVRFNWALEVFDAAPLDWPW